MHTWIISDPALLAKALFVEDATEEVAAKVECEGEHKMLKDLAEVALTRLCPAVGN